MAAGGLSTGSTKRTGTATVFSQPVRWADGEVLPLDRSDLADLDPVASFDDAQGHWWATPRIAPWTS